MKRAPLALAVVVIGSCTVPSLESLGPSRCDLAMNLGCIDGEKCIEGRCLPESYECIPTSHGSCNNEPFMCPAGDRVCGDAGQWGACSTDPLHPQELETRCDGLDNDCDGLVDISHRLPGPLGNDPSLVSLPDAGLILFVGGPATITAQRFSADLGTEGTSVTVSSKGAISPIVPRARQLPGGGAAVIWRETPMGFAEPIFAWATVSTSGVVGGPFIAVMPGGAAREYHDLAVSADGRQVMTSWTRSPLYSVRLFNIDGGPVTSELMHSLPNGTLPEVAVNASAGSGWAVLMSATLDGGTRDDALALEILGPGGATIGSWRYSIPGGGQVGEIRMQAVSPTATALAWVERTATDQRLMAATLTGLTVSSPQLLLTVDGGINRLRGTRSPTDPLYVFDSAGRHWLLRPGAPPLALEAQPGNTATGSVARLDAQLAAVAFGSELGLVCIP